MELLKPIPEDKMNKIPADVFERLKTHLGNMRDALLAKDPQMPNHLRESHRLLISYPETVHLLEDEGIATLIQAAEEHTKTKIISEASKGKGSKGKSKVSVDDL